MWNNYNNGYNNMYGKPINNMPNNFNAYQPPAQINKIYVTSADDALSRFASPNTVTDYWLQDESCIFEVYTDFQGKKNIITRPFEKAKEVPTEQPKNDLGQNYVTRTEFDELKNKLDTLLNTNKNTTKKKAVEVDE